MIWGLCDSEWYCNVLSRARELSTLKNNQEWGRTIPLVDIKSWVRGGALIVEHDLGEPIIRLSCDTLGHVRIERLASVVPGEYSGSNKRMTYIVDQAERFTGVLLEFQVRKPHLAPQKYIKCNRRLLSSLGWLGSEGPQAHFTSGTHLALHLSVASLLTEPISKTASINKQSILRLST
jgi:hypothetical protein